MSGPNKEQQRAIDATALEDVIISAGAGSGKTFTLSIKIYEMVRRGDVKPSQLLVLTFTDNAAHEMKERILRRFKENQSPYASEMISSHVQTFDSFALYLVTKYAGRLSLSTPINILPEDLLASKKAEFLDAVFQSHYEKDKARMMRVLSRYNLQDDKSTKDIVLSLYHHLDSLLPALRKDFIEHYEERYLSKEFYSKLREEAYKQHLGKVSAALRYAEFLEAHADSFKEDPASCQQCFHILNRKELFEQGIENLSFRDEGIQELVHDMSAVLNGKDLDSFFHFFADLSCNFDHYFKKKKTKKKKGEVEAEKTDCKIARDFLKKELPLPLLFSMSEEEGYERILRKKEDILFLLELEEELRIKMEDYQKRTNSYPFSVISNLALSLLQNSEYEDCAEEIRNQFRFVMIDEYQDTNDLQEAFIAGLMKERKDGGRAHLFCVGDAKQSIYGFRNSNVALFNRRIDEYSAGKENQSVIAMNTNYRSERAVLDDINYIFDSYMTMDHGDIEYTSELQQLKSGRQSPADFQRKEGYGITRLNYVMKSKMSTAEKRRMECLSIIGDIQDRIRRNEMVGDRKIRYSDFCIIVRTKSNYAIYQELFQQYGIPLNNKAKANLKGIDALNALQSLLSLMDYRMHGTKADVRHLFASVARSYLFSYSDQKIYDLVTATEEREVDGEVKTVLTLTPLLGDDIMKKVDVFIQEHRGESFSSIFLALLREFSVIEKLYRISNVQDNLDKIECINQMVKASETMGEGLTDFVLRFKNLDKYGLNLSADTIIAEENAVDLMTIHASKGLEREVVYLPVSSNELSKGSTMTKSDFDFSLEYGILLPDYTFGRVLDEESKVYHPLPNPIETLPYYLFRHQNKDPDRAEHVRLVYVALTRAKSHIVIVGDEDGTEVRMRSRENLYGMLSFVNHKTVFTEETWKKVAPLMSDGETGKYKTLVQQMENFPMAFARKDFRRDADYEYYKAVYDYLRETLNRALTDFETAVLLRLYEKRKKDINPDSVSPAEMARMYYLDPSIHDFDACFEAQKGTLTLSEDEGEEENVDEESGDEENQVEETNCFLSKDDMKAALEEYCRSVFAEDKSLYPFPQGKASDEEMTSRRKLFYLQRLLAMKGDSPLLTEVSYRREGIYPDLHQLAKMPSLSFANDIISVYDPLLHGQVDDAVIAFPAEKKERASMSRVHDGDNDVSEALGRGVRLHKIMELVSFTTRDVSFLKKESERRLVRKILALPLFDGVTEEMVKKEYTYYDEEFLTYGSIDLLIHKGENYLIIDYKTGDISHEEYDRQLSVYRRNLSHVLSVPEERISGVVLSLTKGTMRKVF